MIKRSKPQTLLPQTDPIAEALLVDSSHLVLEKSPPDYVVKISQYLESSVRQSGPNEDLPGSDGDSGDSLFVTQKPVPEAVRSRRQRRSSSRSNLTFPTELEDEDDSLLSFHSGTKTNKKRRTAINLPKYDFPFLKERTWRSDTKWNVGLHNCATAGFFECVRELWQSRQRGQVLQTSLPTMDIDGGYISPLSQDEETSEGEDIRVVQRKRFVSSLKPKSSQPWYERGKIDGRVKQHCKIKQPRDITSHETAWKVPDMTSTPSAPLPLEAKSNQHVTTEGSICQTETPNTKRGRKRLLFSQKEQEDKLCEDSDATLSDLSPENYIPTRREMFPTVTQPQADVFHTDLLSQTEQEECEPESQSLLQIDTHNDTVCSETGLQTRKKKKKHRENRQSTGKPASQHIEITEVEETLGVSQAIDEPDSHEKNWSKQPLHDDNMLRQEQMDISERKQKKKKKREQSETEEVRQEAEADLRMEETLGVDEPESHETDWTKRSLHDDNMLRHEQMVISERKQKKKKKREQSETEEVRQEAEADLRVEEDSVSNTENEGKKKKKKKKRKRNEEEEQVEMLKSDKPLNDDTDMDKDRGPNMSSDHTSTEQFEAPQDLESSYVKRKKHKKKQQTVSNNDTQAEEDDCTDANVSDGLSLAERTALSVTKKNKRIDARMNGSHTEESTTEGLVERGAELVTKKKKVSSVEDDGAVAQSDDSAWKKENKRTSSFLVAASLSEAAHVWHAEKPAVSNGDFTSELAEMVASLEKSDEGVRKKKKKKNPETPNEALQVDLDEMQAWIKKKKKKKESVSLPETSDAGCCQIDEDVVSKKKKKKEMTDGQESAATEETLNTCNSAVDATVHDSSTCSEQVDKQMVELALETPEKQALNKVRDKKKKKKRQVEDTFNDETTTQEHKKKKKQVEDTFNDETTTQEHKKKKKQVEDTFNDETTAQEHKKKKKQVEDTFNDETTAQKHKKKKKQ